MQQEQLISGSGNKPILIDITFDKTAGSRPVIVYAHGFNGFKDWGNFDLIANRFVQAGFTFVKFNFSHNGTTPEQPEVFADLEAFAENNYTRELYDLSRVIDWITAPEHPYAAFMNTRRIGLIGHSMGGGISIIHTAEDTRIKALVTWASISECKTPWGSWPEEKLQEWKTTGVQYYLNSRTKQQMPMHYQLYEDFQQNKERLNILRAAAQIKVPFLVCHGTADTSVPADSARQLCEANENAGLLLVDSDHVFGRKHPWTGTELPPVMEEVVNKNIDFFRKALEQ